MAETERQFRDRFLRRLKVVLPGCVVLKNDANYQQGIPDYIVLFGDRWAMLELKRSSNAARQQNQEYYIEYFNQMSFAAFVCPENEEEILYALQRSYQS